MIYLIVGVVLIGGMWLVTRIKQECLWCGRKERLQGRILCSFCKTLAGSVKR